MGQAWHGFMSDTIIRVENLGKKYIIGHRPQGGVSKYSTLRDSLVNSAKSFWQNLIKPKSRVKRNQEEFWALQDVSFEVKQGECVGIIGRNGAGKSTLLKILSRITEPTTGRIEIGGRVASSLEVGTGFHPELTGRENIYLNGAVLGMSRQEIKRKFDEIVAFAEVERFLDTPVKRYSSGMYMRLAFAVAANLEPEILVVDEVLAVGDIAFQKKCLGKMGEVAREEGRTVLFVSHNMVAIRQLCRQSIWLNCGTIKEQGDSDTVISGYLSAEKKKNEEGWISTKDHFYYYQNPRGLTFTRIQIINEQGQPVSSIPFRGELKLLLELKVIEPVEGIRIGIVIHSLDGNLITAFHQTDKSNISVTHFSVGVYHLYMNTQIDLMPNYYMISLFTKPLPGFWSSQHSSWDYVENIFMFSVEQPSENEENILPSGSMILPQSEWNFKKVD